MKPQAGKRYFRADGEITDYLAHKRMDGVLYLYDKYHDAYYITTGYLRNESEATDPTELVAEYHEPDTTKTVRGAEMSHQEDKKLKLQEGARYDRYDGKVTGELVKCPPTDAHFSFYDPKHDIMYKSDGSGWHEFSLLHFTRVPEAQLTEEYFPDTQPDLPEKKTVKRWNWVCVYMGIDKVAIIIMRTEQEAMDVAKQNKALLLGRIQESLIETEE